MTTEITVQATEIEVSLTVSSVVVTADYSQVNVEALSETAQVVASNEQVQVVCQSSATTVVALDPQAQVITGVEQGPPGPRGPAGTSGASQEIVPAGETISALKPIVVIDGLAYIANASNPLHRGFFAGISTTAAAISGNVTIQNSGQIQDAVWAWDVSKSWVFVGNGVLTQAPPSGWCQAVARVEESDTVFVNPQQVLERS